MSIKLYAKSNIPANDAYAETLNAFLAALTDFKCDNHFDGLLSLSQVGQKRVVDSFRQNLRLYFEATLPEICWREELSPNNTQKDSIDVFGSSNSCSIVIEIDKHRADQVAKKFVSRNAMLADKRIIYVAMCYKGTDRMNLSECIKYFDYCNCLSKKLNNIFVGCIVS